jgi:REP element-mobilizing transposase RayT
MGHTFASVYVHVVFSTKERASLIAEPWRVRLYEYMAGVAREEFGRAISLGGTENHLHGLLSIGTDNSIGEIMAKWKALSSGWAHKTLPKAAGFAWQSGYGVFSVSRSNMDKVVSYIEGQAEHHKTRTFEEEFVALLKRHGIPYDPRRLWD